MGKVRQSTVLQPLREGGLAGRMDVGAAFVFEGDKGRGYASVDKLVEGEFAFLQKALTNETCKQRAPFLQRDTAGNIWVIDFNDARVCTGKACVPLSESGIKEVKRMGPAEGGKKMLVLGWKVIALAELKDGVLQVTRRDATPQAFNAASGYDEYGLYVDSENRSWLRLEKRKVAYLDEEGQHEMSGTPWYPTLEDKAGRIWCLNSLSKKITVLLPDSQQAEFAHDGLYDRSSLVEGKPGSLWLTTTKGLSHLAVEDRAGKVQLKRGEDFTANLPRGTTWSLWVDGQGALWTAEPGGLWRIETK